MRNLAWVVALGTALAGLWIFTPPGESVETALSPGTIQLELPELATGDIRLECCGSPGPRTSGGSSCTFH